MGNITFTQLSFEELRAFIRQELKAYFEANPLNTESRKPTDDFLTADQTADFLGISKATIYSKVSRRELPVMKRGKRLYSSQDELTASLERVGGKRMMK